MAKKSTALAKYKAQLAAMVKAGVEQEKNVGGGQFFSIRQGNLTFDGGAIPGNEMAVVVLAHCIENTYYAGDYDPDKQASPACYSFGTDEGEMVPHEASPNKQSKTCSECAHNEFGSAERGKGKACKNRRRLALVTAGKMHNSVLDEAAPSVDVVLAESPGYFGVPPTSIKAWAKYVRDLANVHDVPPLLAITRVSVHDDPKVQVRVEFECLAMTPDEWIPKLLEAHEKAQSEIMVSYPTFEDAEPAKAKKKGKKKGKKRAPKY